MRINELITEKVAIEPHAKGYQKDKLTMPANTLVIDTPGDLDWYKLGHDIANLDQADPHEYGQGDSDVTITSANPEEMRKLMKQLDRLGLKYKSIGGTSDQPEIHSESNPFTDARMNAIKAGKNTFKVSGRTYKVTGDTSDEENAVTEVNIDNKKGRGAVPDNQEVDYFGKRVMMKPSTFIKLASKLGKDPEPEMIDYIKKGGAIGSPFLVIHVPRDDDEDNDKITVSAHEGRNRMLAIMKAEGDAPVETHLFFSGKYNRARHLEPEFLTAIQSELISQDNQLIKGPLWEDGRIVKGVNTTPDVGVNQTKIEAAKFGNTVTKDGVPPTLSNQVKGKSTNVAFNLGLTESLPSFASAKALQQQYEKDIQDKFRAGKDGVDVYIEDGLEVNPDVIRKWGINDPTVIKMLMDYYKRQGGKVTEARYTTAESEETDRALAGAAGVATVSAAGAASRLAWQGLKYVIAGILNIHPEDVAFVRQQLSKRSQDAVYKMAKDGGRVEPSLRKTLELTPRMRSDAMKKLISDIEAKVAKRAATASRTTGAGRSGGGRIPSINDNPIQGGQNQLGLKWLESKEPRYTASEWAIIEGGHSLEDIKPTVKKPGRIFNALTQKDEDPTYNTENFADGRKPE